MFKAISFIVCFILLLVPRAVLADEVVDVSIKGFKFIPAIITVKKGTKIRWTNNEKRQYHSVWFEKNGDPEADYFFPEEFYEKSFENVGSFPYRCGPHPEMLGEVIVTD